MEQGSDVEEAASLEEEEAVDGAMEEAVEEAPTQDEGNEDLSPRVSSTSLAPSWTNT